ncbi:Non-hemolytic phospholipase C precursor [compost metagenome]
MPDGGFLQALRDDVAAGTLPQVSWIVAPATYSEHPGPSSPVQGAWYTQEVLNALTANPAVWSKTVLLINFDENDGYFDHVPPPCAPAYDGDTLAGATTLPAGELAAEYHVDKHPYGPGPRVPMYVVSPWSRGGWVNSQVFDHTSVLRFLEARFGVVESNISGFRRAVAGDLISAFNFVSPNTNPLPSLPNRDKAGADAIRTAQGVLPQVPLPPAGTQPMPPQERGTRPSRALPYELHVSAREDTRERVVRLLFANTGKAAAVFHVYDRLHLDRVPRRYMVEPGKELHGSWDVFAGDAGKYDLWVLGPNGFHRAFSGDVAAAGAASASAPEIRVCYDIANAAVYLDLINTGSAACTFTVRPNAYRNDGPWSFEVPAGKQLQQHWPVGLQGNWYDFTVTASQGSFTRRFAGRIETGKDSVSDPAMGVTG